MNNVILAVLFRIKTLSVCIGPEARAPFPTQPSQEVANKDKFELKKEVSSSENKSTFSIFL